MNKEVGTLVTRNKKRPSRATHHNGAHPLLHDEGSVDLLEEPEEPAVRLLLMALWQLHAEQDVQAVLLENRQDKKHGCIAAEQREHQGCGTRVRRSWSRDHGHWIPRSRLGLGSEFDSISG